MASQSPVTEGLCITGAASWRAAAANAIGNITTKLGGWEGEASARELIIRAIIARVAVNDLYENRSRAQILKRETSVVKEKERDDALIPSDSRRAG
eukprot:238025-Pleurochrysis_carterae.AAC.1